MTSSDLWKILIRNYYYRIVDLKYPTANWKVSPAAHSQQENKRSKGKRWKKRTIFEWLGLGLNDWLNSWAHWHKIFPNFHLYKRKGSFQFLTTPFSFCKNYCRSVLFLLLHFSPNSEYLTTLTVSSECVSVPEIFICFPQNLLTRMCRPSF